MGGRVDLVPGHHIYRNGVQYLTYLRVLCCRPGRPSYSLIPAYTME